MKRILKRATANLALAGLYFIAGKFGLSLAFVHASATAVWPPTGLALAALVVIGYWLWPGILAGAFVVNVTTAGNVATSLGIATGNTLEGLVGAWLLQRYAGGREAFDRARNIAPFVILVAILTPTLSATVGLASLTWSGFAQSDYLAIWLTWWMGDMVSALIIAPLLLIWSAGRPARLNARRLWEALGILSLLILSGQFVFHGWFFSRPENFPLEYLTVPPLLWSAFRFKQHGASLAALVLSAIALSGTLRQLGPFATKNPNQSLLLLQAFMGTLTVTALVLATVVSERERAQDALRQSETRLRTALDAGQLGVWEWDIQNQRVTWSDRLYEFHGLPRNAFDGTVEGFIRVLHPDDVAPVSEAIRKAVEERQPYELEFRSVLPSGEVRWFKTAARVIFDGQNRPVRMLGGTVNLTEYKKMEFALRESQELLAGKAEALEHLVSDRTARLQETIAELETLSYSIAHDLRAPLRAMQNYANCLLEECAEKLVADELTYLRRIASAADRMDQLTNDVLIYNQAARLEMPLEPVDVDKLAREIIEQYPGFQPPRSQIQIVGVLPPVLAHKTSLTQCLSNLLGNAVKFVSPESVPSVTLSAAVSEDTVRIFVQDKGIGIAARDQERIFRMFERVHPPELFGGTGIGLSIVKKAIGRMGGNVGVESELGKGSRFWIELPRAKNV